MPKLYSKEAGGNLINRIKNDEMYFQMMQQQKENLTNWTAKATAFKPRQYYVRQQRELDEEVEFTNKDIKATRNRKLKALYDEDMVQWEQELNARGLSMAKDWA